MYGLCRDATWGLGSLKLCAALHAQAIYMVNAVKF